MMLMTNTIAIDFGTMRTKLAYIDTSRNKPEVMRLGHDDKPYIPSIFYLGKDGKRLFGDKALDFLEDDPIGFLRRPLKRDLRESLVRAGNREKASPTELLTLLIAGLRKRAKELPAFHKQLPSSLYLTIPVQYGPPDERVLMEAALGAGFEEGKVYFVKEPVSAAQVWLSELGGAEEYVVVLDCGGGTLDWACLHRTKSGEFEIVVDPPPGGDNKVGGYNIDDNIYEVIKDRTEDESILKELETRSSYVRDQIRIIKEKYSRSKVGGRIKIAGANIEIGGAELESIIQNRFIDQVCDNFGPYISKVKDKLKLSNPSVLLVGGSSRIRGLKEALQEREKCNPIWWERSDYATVLGALPIEKNDKFITKQKNVMKPQKLEEKSTNTVDYLKLGLEYYEKGKYDLAIKNYNEAIKLNPRDADTYNNRGLAYDALENYNLAIKDYNKAIKLDSKDADYYNIRGLAFYELEEYDRAIKDYNKAIKLDSKDADYYNNRGLAFYELEEYDRAIKDYNKAIKIDPNNTEYYKNRGSAYEVIGKYDSAIEDYKKAGKLGNFLIAKLNRYISDLLG